MNHSFPPENHESDEDPNSLPAERIWKPIDDGNLIAYVKQHIGQLLGRAGFDLETIAVRDIVTGAGGRRITARHQSGKEVVLFSFQKRINRFGPITRQIEENLWSILPRDSMRTLDELHRFVALEIDDQLDQKSQASQVRRVKGMALEGFKAIQKLIRAPHRGEDDRT
ncbi:MAG: hypothetical protein PHZ00_04030 [Candidatus Peribacteraceae bacterium]|nr:hypothetical protein [Candidatus Peribacteraceae bacterium]